MLEAELVSVGGVVGGGRCVMWRLQARGVVTGTKGHCDQTLKKVLAVLAALSCSERKDSTQMSAKIWPRPCLTAALD